MLVPADLSDSSWKDEAVLQHGVAIYVSPISVTTQCTMQEESRRLAERRCLVLTERGLSCTMVAAEPVSRLSPLGDRVRSPIARQFGQSFQYGLGSRGTFWRRCPGWWVCQGHQLSIPGLHGIRIGDARVWNLVIAADCPYAVFQALFNRVHYYCRKEKQSALLRQVVYLPRYIASYI